MAEVEIHTSHEHGGDAFTKGVSVMVGVIGIVLAFVTIASHRAHTAAVIHRTEANDQWSYYDSQKEREHLMDVAAGLLGVVQVTQADKAQALAAKYAQGRDKYLAEATQAQQDAKAREAESRREEARGLRLDLGEGLLELGLVLTSLFFLARQRLFPVIGILAAIAGGVVAATNFLA
ncbi:MAG TPA: DUF4337 family protein [Steroidobacteraceae bacterium]|jgi:hypothetical protein|nr:DUF4337 family protein [Steroidobacteraceae bacterium]